MQVKIIKKNAFPPVEVKPKYWGPLAPYMCGVLENPKADDDAKRFVTNEFQRLATLVDKYNDATWDREERVNRAKFELNSLRCLLEKFKNLKHLRCISADGLDILQDELANGLKHIKSLEDFVNER